MNRILEIDVDDLRAVVEPGVVNIRLGAAMAPFGLSYVPDPSSQKACTIGGNVGDNSGGPHTLRYGVTTNHTFGLEVVLPDGEIVRLGGSATDSPGYDLIGLLVGSEGTLGIVTAGFDVVGRHQYAAALWYGVPWCTSSCADLTITLTSGCCLPWVASQPSGT